MDARSFECFAINKVPYITRGLVPHQGLVISKLFGLPLFRDRSFKARSFQCALWYVVVVLRVHLRFNLKSLH